MVHKPLNPDRFDWAAHAEATLHTTFTVIAAGKRIPVFVASDRLVNCDNCVSRQRLMNFGRLTCAELPECSNLAFMEDTPENRAKYTAALITGKWVP